MKKGSKAYSIFKNRCPVCHEGKPFPKGSYTPGFAKMDSICDHCGHKYEIENGFFYGAMYASYGIVVAIMVTMVVATYVLIPNADSTDFIVAASIGVIVTVPLTFRGGRLIWMNMFSRYKEDAIKQNNIKRKEGN